MSTPEFRFTSWSLRPVLSLYETLSDDPAIIIRLVKDVEGLRLHVDDACQQEDGCADFEATAYASGFHPESDPDWLARLAGLPARLHVNDWRLPVLIPDAMRAFVIYGHEDLVIRYTGRALSLSIEPPIPVRVTVAVYRVETSRLADRVRAFHDCRTDFDRAHWRLDALSLLDRTLPQRCSRASEQDRTWRSSVTDELRHLVKTVSRLGKPVSWHPLTPCVRAV